MGLLKGILGVSTTAHLGLRVCALGSEWGQQPCLQG